MKNKLIVLLMIIGVIVISICGILFFKNKLKKEIVNNKVESNNSKENNEIEILEYMDSMLCYRNTYTSIVKNYSDRVYEVMDKYCSGYDLIGDSVVGTKVKCNYNQYEHSYETMELIPYGESIKFQIAKMHESTFNLANYNENLSFEEVVKLQSQEGINYVTGEKIGKDGYFEITGMFIMNGNNISEAVWKSNSRAKKISVIINNEEEYGFDLEDTMEVQLIDLNYRQDGIDTPIDLEIKILDVYEGEVSDNVFISDIGFGLESSIKGGR